MKEKILMILSTILEVIMYIIYLPIAAVAVCFGAIAVTVRGIFAKILSGNAYEEGTYEDALIKLLNLLL